MLNFLDTHTVIGRFCSRDTADLFADGWERFPTGDKANIVLADLSRNKLFWEKRCEENAGLIQEAIETIEHYK